MDCDAARDALSTILDGEDLAPGLSAAGVERHLARCGDCQAWRAGAEHLRSTWRMEETPAAPDMRIQLLREFDRVRGRGRLSSGPAVTVLRVALLLVALLQLAVVVPTLVLGHDREAPLHVAHEMGSFQMAVVFGLLAVAYRPAWAAGLAWFAVAAASALAVTAVSDLADGATTPAEELPHLLIVIAAVVLVCLARPHGRRLC